MNKSSTKVILSRLKELHPKSIDLTLDRIHSLLDRLDNPHLKLPPIIHIAGTNGKGSVLAMLSEVLIQSSYSHHAYISPHLVDFNERIILAGEAINEDFLFEILHECERANGDSPITFFEITTAAAFLAFSRIEADVLLLEVGLGGRLDATNVVIPELSIITNISIDHQQFLGETIEEITREKSGILKPRCPAIISKQEEKSRHIIEKIANEVGSPLHMWGRDFEVKSKSCGIYFRNDTLCEIFPNPSLVGEHQIENAGLVIAASNLLSKSLFKKINSESIGKGLKHSVWPGRLQKIDTKSIPRGWELWIDGGHNIKAAKVLSLQLKKWKAQPLHLIVGMINTKDVGGFLQYLEGYCKSITALKIPNEDASLSPESILSFLGKSNADVYTGKGIDDSISIIRQKYPKIKSRILICGSLYLAGYILEHFDGKNSK